MTVHTIIEFLKMVTTRQKRWINKISCFCPFLSSQRISSVLIAEKRKMRNLSENYLSLDKGEILPFLHFVLTYLHNYLSFFSVSLRYDDQISYVLLTTWFMNKVFISICLIHCLFVRLFVFSSILSFLPSFLRLFVFCLFVCLFTCLFVCLFVCLIASVCLR